MKDTSSTVRVAFLVAHLHKGGMQRAISNITHILPSNFIQYVVYFGTEKPGFDYHATEILLPAEGSLNLGLAGKVVNFIKRIFLLRQFIQKNNIDVVVSFGETASVINLISLHSARKVVSVRVSLRESLKEHKIWGRVYRFLITLLYPYADYIVAVSFDLVEEINLFVKNKASVVNIPNVYNRKFIIKQAQDPFPLEHEAWFQYPTIVNVGSLCYQKGQDILLQAFVDVKKAIPNAVLILVGRGPWKAKLQKMSENLDVASSVRWVDFLPNPYPYMAKASVFVLASRYEGFPNVLVEAMICGTPVISFDCPTGPSEILSKGKYGLLIEYGNIELLSKGIVAIINEAHDEHERRCSLSIEGSLRYSMESTKSKWETLLISSNA